MRMKRYQRFVIFADEELEPQAQEKQSDQDRTQPLLISQSRTKDRASTSESPILSSPSTPQQQHQPSSSSFKTPTRRPLSRQPSLLIGQRVSIPLAVQIGIHNDSINPRRRFIIPKATPRRHLARAFEEAFEWEETSNVRADHLANDFSELEITEKPSRKRRFTNDDDPEKENQCLSDPSRSIPDPTTTATENTEDDNSSFITKCKRLSTSSSSSTSSSFRSPGSLPQIL